MKESASPKSPLIITAVQLGLLLFAVYYAFIGGQTAQGIYDHTWRLTTLYLTTAIIGGWLLWRLSGRTKIPRTPLDFPLLVIFVSWLAATLFSINPIYSRETLVFFVTYLFFFYLAADLGRRRWFKELAINALLMLSGFVFAFALLQLWWWYQDHVSIQAMLPPNVPVEANPPRLSVLGNPNTMASFIALVLPLTLYKMISVTNKIGRVLLGGWLLLLALAILLTQSRGGIVGGAVATSAFAAVWIFHHRNQSTPGGGIFRVTWSKRWTWILGAIIFAGFILFARLLFEMRGISGSVSIRQQLMLGALTVWRQHPVTGVGLGALGQALIRFQQPFNQVWADAHNLYLTILAETGMVGAVGLLWLIWVNLRLLWGTLKHTDTAWWEFSSLACAAALAGFAAHNLIDSLLKFPVIMLLVAILAGFWIIPYSSPSGLAGFSDGTNSPPKPWKRWMILVSIFVLVITFIVGRQGIRHIETYNQAVEAANRGQWLDAFEKLRIVNRLAPDMPFYQRQLGFVAGYLKNRPTAIDHYRAALTQVDQLAVDHANLACLQWENGQQAEAVQEMTMARRLEPTNAVYSLNLGYYLENTGNLNAAWAEYARTLALEPDFLHSGFWQQTQQRAAALPEIIRLAEAGKFNVSLSKSVQLHLVAGNTALAHRVVDLAIEKNKVSGIAAHQEKAKILLAERHFDEARAELGTALSLAPARGILYYDLSRVALAQGQLTEAEQNISIALNFTQRWDILYQAGVIAAALGNDVESAARFEQASTGYGVLSHLKAARYATEVARRRPLPKSYLPCLGQPYPPLQPAAFN